MAPPSVGSGHQHKLAQQVVCPFSTTAHDHVDDRQARLEGVIRSIRSTAGFVQDESFNEQKLVCKLRSSSACLLDPQEQLSTLGLFTELQLPYLLVRALLLHPNDEVRGPTVGA